MSVKVRPYKRGGWEVDIRIELPSGEEVRRRKKSPVSSKSGSKRWGEDRETSYSKSSPNRPSNDPKETQRYMHLSPAAIEGAIRLLDDRKTVSDFGDMLETVVGERAKSDS